MSFRSIVIYLDREESVRPLVMMANRIEESNQSHLIAVHTIPGVDAHLGVGAVIPMGVLERVAEQRLAEARLIQDAFKSVAQELDASYEWHEYPAVSTGDDTHVVAHALVADLVITSQSSNMVTPWLQRDLLQRSGAPLLLIPTDSGMPNVFNRIAVAWNGTAQAARAIRDAMPLLEQSNLVQVVCLPAKGPASLGDTARIARWLSSHNIEAIIEEPSEQQADSGIRLVDEVMSTGAELLVCGGYSHSPLYNAFLGGTTDDVIRGAEIPVFLSH